MAHSLLTHLRPASIKPGGPALLSPPWSSTTNAQPLESESVEPPLLLTCCTMMTATCSTILGAQAAAKVDRMVRYRELSG